VIYRVSFDVLFLFNFFLVGGEVGVRFFSPLYGVVGEFTAWCYCC